MKSYQQKLEEAIARNSQAIERYLNQADKNGLTGQERIDFVKHKIGVPKKMKYSVQ